MHSRSVGNNRRAQRLFTVAAFSLGDFLPRKFRGAFDQRYPDWLGEQWFRLVLKTSTIF